MTYNPTDNSRVQANKKCKHRCCRTVVNTFLISPALSSQRLDHQWSREHRRVKGELGNSRTLYLHTAFQRTQAQIPHSLKLDNWYVNQYTRHVKWVPVTTARRFLRLCMEETAFRYGGFAGSRKELALQLQCSARSYQSSP